MSAFANAMALGCTIEDAYYDPNACANEPADTITNLAAYVAGSSTYKYYYQVGDCHAEREQNGNDESSCDYDNMTQNSVHFNDWVRGWMEVSGYSWNNVKVSPASTNVLPTGDSSFSNMIDSNGNTTNMYTYVDDPVGMNDGTTTEVRSQGLNGTDSYHTTTYPTATGTFTTATVHVIATGTTSASCTLSVELFGGHSSTGDLAGDDYSGGSFGGGGLYADRPISLSFEAITNPAFKLKVHLKNANSAGYCQYTQVYISTP
jgi:hypothetical protein